MRNNLSKSRPWKQESAVINLDDKNGRGTHWVAHKKNGDDVIYLDSFGNLQLPNDIMIYLDVGSVKYYHQKYQDYDTVVDICIKNSSIINYKWVWFH